MRLIQYAYPSYRSLAPLPGPYFRTPWPGLETEVDRLFASALVDLAGRPATDAFPVDLYEDDGHAYVRAELPGVNRDDIGVELGDGFLTISAKRQTPAPAGQPEESVSLSRSVAIHDAVQPDKVAAAYENGVLTVTLPKREDAKPRKIAVAVK
jgi:HSP20 family protein